jgi:hypothetical protein
MYKDEQQLNQPDDNQSQMFLSMTSKANSTTCAGIKTRRHTWPDKILQRPGIASARRPCSRTSANTIALERSAPNGLRPQCGTSTRHVQMLSWISDQGPNSSIKQQTSCTVQSHQQDPQYDIFCFSYFRPTFAPPWRRRSQEAPTIDTTSSPIRSRSAGSTTYLARPAVG